MIYSPRAQPKVNKSHIPMCLKITGLFFTWARYQLWRLYNKHTFLRCFDVGTLKENIYFSGPTLNNSKKGAKDALGFPHCKTL